MEQRESSLAVQPYHRVEVLPGELSVRPGAGERRKEVILIPRLGNAGGHQLLGEDVQRAAGLGGAVQLAVPHGMEQRGGADQLVPGERKDATFRSSGEGVAGTAHSLQPCGDGRRDAYLNHEVDGRQVFQNPSLPKAGVEGAICV